MVLKAVSNANVLSSAGVSGITNLYSGISNAQALLFPKYRKALANVRNGTADARILIVGDSVVSGTGTTLAATLPNLGAWPTRLAQLLNGTVTPAAVGIGIPTSNLGSGLDNRWTIGGTWVKNAFGPANGGSFSAIGPSGNLVYASGILADSYYVYYAGGSGVGTSLTFTATGGTPVVINPSSGPLGTYRQLVTTGSASASNTVTIVAANGSTNVIMGVEPLLSTKKQILVGNAGVGGATAHNWASAPFGGVYGCDFIRANAPDLMGIMIGINDAGNSTLAATVMADVQVLITAGQVSGDVFLMTMPPTQTAPFSTYEPSYVDGYKQLAASNNIALCNTYERFGSVWYAPLMNDNAHPNDQGHWDIGDQVSRFLNFI